MFDIQNYNSFIGAILRFQRIPGIETITLLHPNIRAGSFGFRG